MSKTGEDEAQDLDVHALLAAAIDRPAPPDLADRVTSRIALADTILEFGRLLGIAPTSAAASAIRDEESSSNASDDDDGGDDA